MTNNFTRRKFIKGGIATLAALNASTFTGLSSSHIQRGGIWKLATAWSPPTLDCQRVSMYWTSVQAMYDCLLRTEIDPETQELHLKPALATDWQIDKDGKRIIFNLRKGVRFHDGSKFDAEVAKWNLDRVRNHPESYLASDIEEIESVEVLGDYTIALQLSYPSVPVLYNLSSGRGWAGFVSKEFQEKHGDEELARHGVGTGPFKFKEWLVDDKIVLERFDDYWREGVDGKSLPYLDGIEEHYRPEIDMAVINLRSGALDTVGTPAERTVPQIEQHSDLVYLKLPPFEYQKAEIILNSREGPFTSKSLRQAAYYALDREKIASIMGFGVGRPHQYPWITRGQPGWDPDNWPDYSYDLDKAEELVKDDYPNGVSVNLNPIQREPDMTIAQIIKNMWDQAGLKTELRGLERNAWIENQHKDNYEASMLSAATYMGGFNQPKLQCGSPGNWGNYCNSKVDEMLQEHKSTFDRGKRHDLMSEILRIVYEDAEMSTCYAVSGSVGTKKDVKNIQTHWRDNLVAEGVWLDR